MIWLALGLITLGIIGGLLFWRHRRRKQYRLISLVALLREPISFDSAVLARLAGDAWKADLSHGDDEGRDGFVVGSGPINTILCKGRMYLINNFDRPYFDDPDEAAESIPDLRLAGCVREHAAWFSIDAMGIDRSTPDDEVQKEYRRIARLLADLLDDNALAIFCPDLSVGYPVNDDTEEALRSKDPLARLQESLAVPIIHVSDDDPRMIAAVTKARSEWPKFVKAFEDRDGENHAVKAPITAGGNTEFIWISVKALEGERIYGELANDPGDLGKLRLGSKVSVKLDELNDWMFVKDGEMIGGFTVQVIQQAAKKKRK